MRSILAIFCIIFTTNAFGKNLRDSVGVESDNGKQIILHKVAPKETYYSIARIYQIAPKEVIAYNKIKVLQPGIIIKVPTHRPFSTQKETSATSSAQLIDYKVGHKETLFAISRRFNTTVDELKRINKMSGNHLAEGQIIKVPLGAANTPVAPPHPPADIRTASPIKSLMDSTDTDSASQDAVRLQPNRYGLTERTEHGAAVWIADDHLDSSKMLALHRTAPIGTVIKITNPMTGKSTFAKVVGKYTENEMTKDVIIVITKATADTLGALDKRFMVDIDYGMPND